MSVSRKNFILHGGILAIAGILVRIIGMLYRIPMVNIIGSEGNGIYSVAFNVYNVMLVLSSYGLPMAVSKLVAHYAALKEYRNAGEIFAGSLLFSIVVGGVAALLIFLGADFLEDTLYAGYEGISLPLRVLAPTLLIVAVLGVFRGFFQGQGSMIPTAFSQLAEQVVNAGVSIGAAMLLVRRFSDSPRLAGYGAAGGTFGTAAGALTALIFLVALYGLYKPYFEKKKRRAHAGAVLAQGEILKMIAFTMAPIILGQTFYQISATIDDVMYGHVMASLGKASSEIKTTIGNFGSSYMILTSLPMGVASAMSSSMLPSIVGSHSRRAKGEICAKIRASVKANMFIVIPSFVGLFVLGQPIIKLLFPAYDSAQGAMMLKIGAISTCFYTLSTVTGSALQGIDKMSVPVRHSAISLAVHVALTYGLLRCTPLGIYGLVIGNATFPVLIFILNFKSLSKYAGYRQEIKKTFLVPGFCALAMGCGCGLCHHYVERFTKRDVLALCAAILAAMAIYFGLMIWCKKHKLG